MMIVWNPVIGMAAANAQGFTGFESAAVLAVGEDVFLGERAPAMLSAAELGAGGVSLQWRRSSLAFYRRSPILQSIDDQFLTSPSRLTARMLQLHQAIGEEQGENYALTTLVGALIAGGRVPGDEQKFQRWAGARDLYDFSPLLQNISDADLQTPEKLVQRLVDLRPSIVEEQRKSRGVDAKRLSNYALATLVLALHTAGRLKRKYHRYRLFASSRDLYDRSEILRSIDFFHLQSPLQLFERLIARTPDIVAEQNRLRPSHAKPVSDYTLGVLMMALGAGGKLGPGPQANFYARLARSRQLYERSEILKNVPEEALATPESLATCLLTLRSAIQEEQRQILERPKIPGEYALVSLVIALYAGGRIRGNPQMYERWASTRDLFDRSKILQGISEKEMETPQALIERLVALKPAILMEQKAHYKKLKKYSLGTLVLALKSGGRLHGNLHGYARFAAARELYDRSPILQSIGRQKFATPQKLLGRLVQLRPDIVREQSSFLRKKKQKGGAHYALNTLVEALHAAGRLSSNAHLCLRLAGARDLFEHSPILQSLTREELATPENLVARLVELRPEIQGEQNQPHYALGTLVFALMAADLLPHKQQNYSRLATARDLYDASPTLQSVSEKDLETDESLMRFLVTFRDKIALEVSGKFSAGLEKKHALNSLLQALYTGGRIGAGRLLNLQFQVGGPLEYFLKRRSWVEPEIQRVLRGEISKHRLAVQTKDQWKSLADSERSLSLGYISHILKWAEWFLTDPAVAVRSLYTGPEIVWMALSPTFFGKSEMVPSDLVAPLLAAADLFTHDPEESRRRAVELIEDLVWRYSGGEFEIDDYVDPYLYRLECVMFWNRDVE